MKSFLTITCALAAACALAPSSAFADPNLTVFVQSVTLPVGTTSGFFDVAVINTGTATDILDTTARAFQDVVNPNIVFGTPVITTNFTPIHSVGFFNHNGGVTNTASNVADNYGAKAQDTISTGESLGLMQVPFTVLNGFTGTVQVDIDNNPDNTHGTSLLMPNGIDYYPYAIQSGDITITPEPASLMLLGLAAPLLLRRRNRR